MKELQVEAIKAKLQKKMGPLTDKAADAVIENMMAMWQSMQTQAKAKEDLPERLRSLWQEK